MPSATNLAIVAAAGSGKTRTLINSAVAEPSRRVLIVTYTNENLRQIETRLQGRPGGRPANVTTMTLFEFLLRECVKPFQLIKTYKPNLIRSIHFQTRPLYANYGGVSDFRRYFLSPSNDAYSDYVSQAAVEINKAAKGEVIKRLELLWDEIYIDEAQDMNGYDLELVDAILASKMRLVLVCDPRQAVYRANNQRKHSKYTGAKFVNWIDERSPVLQKCNMTTCHRSAQSICDFADSLYADLPKTSSAKVAPAGRHTGMYLVSHDDIGAYREAHNPQELRWNRENPNAGPNARNMRGVKGLGFKDVLIHPSQTMMDHLEKGKDLAETSRAALYVAVTRAEYSVGIVTKKKSTKTQLPFWEPMSDESVSLFEAMD